MSAQDVVYDIMTVSAPDASPEALAQRATQSAHPIHAGPELNTSPNPKHFVFVRPDAAQPPAPGAVRVRFTSDARPALRAPVTEIARLTAKSGAHDAAAGERLLDATARAVALFGANSRGAACGRVVGRAGEVVAIAGWDSVEEHRAFRARTSREMKDITEVWYGTAHVALSYAALAQHGGAPKSRL